MAAAAAPSEGGGAAHAPSDAPALLWSDVCYRVGRGRGRKWVLSGVSVRCAARHAAMRACSG